jgi:autotransporter-associated beta strand protein
MKKTLGGIVIAATGWASAFGFTDKVTDTPYFEQEDFGQTGQLLPGDGTMYCGPVAVADSLVWLARNGYTELAPAQGTLADNVNLIRTLGGLFETSPTGGTGGAQQDEGVVQYMRLKGFGETDFTYTVAGPTYFDDMPTWNFLEAKNAGASVVTLNLVWYAQGNIGGTATGGHNIALLATDQSAGTLTVSNPFPAKTPNPQVQPMSVISSGPLAGFLKFDNAISGTSDVAVLQYARALTILRAPGEAPKLYTISGTEAIDTNGAALTVLAPIDGSGLLQKTGAGTLDLVNTTSGAYTYTGGTNVERGQLIGRVSSGTPFGTGGLATRAAEIVLAPATVNAPVALAVASAPNTRWSYSAGNTLTLDRGGNPSLAVTIGGYTDGVTRNLQAQPGGTLVIAPTTGLSELGGNVRVLVSGTAGNLPETAMGIVRPNLVGANGDASASGDFLAYDAANGFRVATYSAVSNLNAATASTIFAATTDQTLTGAAAVGALKIAGVTIGATAPGTSLAVGPGGSGNAGGVIFNGGAISAAVNLDFGGARASIYTSGEGGAISGVLSGADEGLDKFGPGVLTLGGANTYTGPTSVSDGKLVVANTSGSATGTGEVTVWNGALLTGSGTVGSNVILQPGGSRTGAGTISGTVSVAAGANLLGGGTISGDTTVRGTLDASGVAGGLHFGGNIAFLDAGILQWTLNTLTDVGTPGTDWSFFSVAGTLDLGSGGVLMLNFAPGLGPDDGNAFWQSDHQWIIADSNHSIVESPTFGGLYEPQFTNGRFQWNNVDRDGGGQSLELFYEAKPVPEPQSVALLMLGGLFALSMWRLKPTPRTP